MPLDLMHGRLLLDKHITFFETPLLAPEGRFEGTIRYEYLKATKSISVDAYASVRGTYYIELFQLLHLYSPLTVPEADLKTFCMCLDLVLPLHERNNWCYNQARLSPRLRQKQGDSLDTMIDVDLSTPEQGSLEDSRLPHSHLIREHPTLPVPLFLLLHPEEALFLER